MEYKALFGIVPELFKHIRNIYNMKKILFLVVATFVALSSYAQRVHFGCVLGQNVDIKETYAYIKSLGYDCRGGGSGSIGEITIYSKVTVDNIQFEYSQIGENR